MKPILIKILSIFLILLSSQVTAQPNPKAFEYSKFTWFGLDFTHAHFIGSAGFTDPNDIKMRYLEGWNLVILDEHNKYDLGKAYGMDWLASDLSIVERRNHLVDSEILVIDQSYTIDPKVIEEIISDYTSALTTEGLGIVYVVETFDKTALEGHMYVVFFDVATHEILWKEKYYGIPAGFGLRNYWAKTILHVIYYSGKDFTKAKKKFNKS